MLTCARGLCTPPRSSLHACIPDALSCTCKCEERKPHGPEKLLHIWAAGLRIGSDGRRRGKLSSRVAGLVCLSRGSFVMKYRASKPGSRQHAKGLSQTRPKKVAPRATFPLYKAYYHWIIAQNCLTILDLLQQLRFCSGN